VVKRAATISDDYSNSQQGAGSKRSVMERLGSNSDILSLHGNQLSNKRCVWCLSFVFLRFDVIGTVFTSQFLGGGCCDFFFPWCRQRGDNSLTSLGANGVKGTSSLILLH
jgi:hypothetical protein